MAATALPGGDGPDDESEGIVAEINVTPLTDIFLVLLIIFMVVDLPAPFGPRNPTTSPLVTLSSTPSTARLSPNVLVSPFASMRFMRFPRYRSLMARSVRDFIIEFSSAIQMKRNPRLPQALRVDLGRTHSESRG